MQFDEYEIIELFILVPQVYRLRVKRKDEAPLFSFTPGQFCQIKNPTSDRPEQPHSFSIASTPKEAYIEFCFKVYGPWTQALAKKQAGEVLHIAGPFGRFVWEEKKDNPSVFLAGGVGVVPMYSMLQGLANDTKQVSITLLYGNRTEDDIAYRSQLESLIGAMPDSKIIHILSDSRPEAGWHGLTGFITKEVLEKETPLSQNPTFFLCGPPVFVQLMKDILKELAVTPEKIKSELYSSPPPPRVS